MPEKIFVHVGRLLDRPGAKTRDTATLEIEAGLITAVRDGHRSVPSDAKLIDLSEYFVLPGLIDCHVHLTFSAGPDFQLWLAQADPVNYAINGVISAALTLQAGFTTVRDLGAPARAAIALRDAINRGRLAGPTILSAGQIISVTASQGDVVGFSRAASEGMRCCHPGIAIDGASAGRSAARQQIRDGADVVKIATTGGVMSNIAGGLGQHMEDDEIAAIVSAAHKFGRKVAVHAHGADGINAALLAGADSIEHATLADERSIELFLRTGAWLVPTLFAVNEAAAAADAGHLPAASALKAQQARRSAFANMARAISAGVRIAFGTDCGIAPHGQNAKEFGLLVSAGMSPMAAIMSATTEAAALLGLIDEVGTLEPGKRADLIAVRGDPLSSIAALETVDFVMHSGITHRSRGNPVPFMASD